MRRRRSLVPVFAGAVVGFALLASGCGGGSPSGVASVSSTTTATAATAATPPNGGLISYSRCMRAHGVPGFPDPDGSGGMSKLQVVTARRSDPSRFDAAATACRGLLPGGSLGPPAQTIPPADRTDYLKAAACMRRHGFPDFPDPTFPNNTVRVEIPASVDQESAAFKSAATTCTKLIPPGLPDSHSGGS